MFSSFLLFMLLVLTHAYIELRFKVYNEKIISTLDSKYLCTKVIIKKEVLNAKSKKRIK